MRMLYLALLLILALITTSATAQKHKKHAKRGRATQKVAVTVPPSANAGKAEMQKLKDLIGDWTTTEKYEANDISPKAGSGTGRARLYWGPGGLTIIQNYRSKNDVFGDFEGYTLVFWDAEAGEFKNLWCDSMMGCYARFGTGRWEGDRLAFSTQVNYWGKKVAMRDTYSDIKPDSFTLAEEVSVEGGPMKPLLTVRYSKAAKAAKRGKSKR
jgi:hypothetical protein